MDKITTIKQSAESILTGNIESAKNVINKEYPFKKLKPEGRSYTDKEKEALIKSFEAQGYDADAIEQQTGRTLEDYVHIELLYEKVLDFLLDNANITGAPTTE